MIQFSPLQTTNPDTLAEIARALSLNHNLECVDGVENRCFLTLDGNQTIGYCLFHILGNGVAQLTQIYIKPTERKFKLGDGLFRAVLNSLEINGVSQVYASGNSEELSFYKHEGLIESESGLVSLESIATFFSKPCKGHKK